MERRLSNSQYELIERLSETALSESWIADNRLTGRRCFLKVSRPDSLLGGELAAELLYRSRIHQKKVRSPLVHTASRDFFFEGRQFVEYPYLPPEAWQTCTPELFWQRFPQSIVGMCAAVDYLHVLEFVHGDLKLSNFLLAVGGDDSDIRLVDLDFLLPSHAGLEHRIFGTRDYIAPEVRAGERVLVESDNYSLGVMIRACLLAAQEREGTVDALARLAEHLTQPDPLDRPVHLLSALERSGAVGPDLIRSAEKAVLRSLLATRFLEERPRIVDGSLTPSALLRNQKCLGLPEELLTELDRAFAVSRKRAIGAVRRCIDRAEVSRLADSWHFKMSDHALVDFFWELERAAPSGIDPKSRAGSAPDLAGALEKARRVRQTGKPLRALLMLLPALSTVQVEDKAEDRRVIFDALIEAAELSLMSFRFADAVPFYERAISMVEPLTERYFSAHQMVLQITATIGDLVGATERVDRLLADHGASLPSGWRIEFERIRAFVDASLGRPAESLTVLTRLLGEAESTGDVGLLVRIHTSLGTTYWRAGQADRARRHYLNSAVMARRTGYIDGLFSALACLAMLAVEVAHYGKVMRYGRAALRLRPSPVTSMAQSVLYQLLVSTSTRLAQYERAEYYQSVFLSIIAPSMHRGKELAYYGDRAFLLQNSGRLREAQEFMRHVLETRRGSEVPRAFSKLATNLALVYLYRGDDTRCRRAAAYAARAAIEAGDDSSKVEAESIESVMSIIRGERQGFEDALRIIEQLLKYRSYAYAMFPTLFVELYGDAEVIRSVRAVTESIHPLIDSSPEPVIKSVGILRRLSPDHKDRSSEAIAELKRVYNILSEARRRFAAMHVCRRIADHYAAAAETKVAHKFYLRAKELAEGMDNRQFAESITGDIKRTSGVEILSASRLQAFLSISQILRHIEDYDASLREVVRFAASETGAERGVLLLRSAATGDFRIKTSLNCDLDSLQDISDFSRSIPSFVAEQRDMVVIADATRDERTREYKSIIAHNIRSVLCVPVWSETELVGALYLDHHTIPAMFDDSDVAFVSALSNFLSVILGAVERVRTVSARAQQLTDDLHRSGRGPAIITQSPKVEALIEGIETFALTSSPLLFQGESGTGKELFCDLAHRLSRRADKPFIKLNCAAIPESMLEAELFGVASRAVTGADEREGRFELADGGTLLLDEIGEMSPAMQAKVLRVIEYGEFERVGSSRTKHCDVRIICATNRNLGAMQAAGEFRLDLFHRINKLTVNLPPLRERIEDIPLLIEHFRDTFALTPSQRPRFDGSLMNLFMQYAWPGNVRELRNVVERCCIVRPGAAVRIHDLPDALQEFERPQVEKSGSAPNRRVLLDALDAAGWDVAAAATRTGTPVATFRQLDEVRERQLMESELRAHSGNISRAARAVGLKLTTFRRRMKRYGL